MRIAFKEWAVVVDALERGDQIIIIRKGGIAEGRGGFQVQHSRFWLFPTLFHQQRDAVVPSAAARYDAIAPGLVKEQVRIQQLAEVVAWARLETFETVKRLHGQHIWREEVLAERFEWGRSKDIIAMAVRVWRLPSPIDLPMAPSYGGCKSWIELEADLDTNPASAVLDDKAFAVKLKAFQAEVGNRF